MDKASGWISFVKQTGKLLVSSGGGIQFRSVICLVSFALCHPERSRGTPNFSRRELAHPNHGAIDVDAG